MYKGLWTLIERHADEESAAGLYLAANIICWTAGTILLGLAASALMQKSIVLVLVDIVCAGAYAGIIFGLIGGIIFLQRREGSGNRQ
uniref:hypothetical protein n=1 Tax=Faecalicatena contorta TaxID=39482 RepID=UPI00359C553D